MTARDFLRKNWFFIGIAAAIAAGFAFSAAGRALNQGSRATNVIIVVIFLASGLTLPTESIGAGVRQVRLHLYTLLFIFALCPLYYVATAQAFKQAVDPAFLAGIYALACLPTTISSCIVFTQSAGGNIVGAMFNAAVANIAGVFLSPLLLSLLLREAGQTLPASELLKILRNLGLLMLVPIAAGQLGRLALRGWATANARRISTAANALILLIIAFAVAQAADNPRFLPAIAGSAVFFVYLGASQVLLTALAYGGARAVGLQRPSVIAATFVAPQKTIAMGVPLITAYFASRPDVLGAAIMPLLFYHPWQLLAAGVVRMLFARGAKDPGGR